MRHKMDGRSRVLGAAMALPLCLAVQDASAQGAPAPGAAAQAAPAQAVPAQPAPAQAALAALGQMIPATLDCSATQQQTAPAISRPITFIRKGQKLTARRLTDQGVGQESFHGSIEPNGLVKMFGLGRYEDQTAIWSYTFG